MSEYQYIHFIAIDRPVDDKQLEYMRAQSSRADVTKRQFTNEYHFGDFHGNAREMLRRGYDAHFHFANFGVRRLMFRFPRLPCDKEVFNEFEIEHCLSWKADKEGDAGILTIEPEADAGTYDFFDDVGGSLESIAPVREMLMRGDLRPLYLAWLACCDDPEQMEPPVPDGLGDLNEPLQAMAELYELPGDLISAAAQNSVPVSKATDINQAVSAWVAKRSKAELQKVVSDLLTGDVGSVRAQLLSEVRRATDDPVCPMTKPMRTFGELRAAAKIADDTRRRQEEESRQRARQKHLDSIAKAPQTTIIRIDKLVEERTPKSLELAAECLSDLAEALGPDQGVKQAKAIADRLRHTKPRSNRLITELRKRGLIE